MEDSVALFAFVTFALLVGGFAIFHAIVLFAGQIDPDVGYGEGRRAEPRDDGVALWRDDERCDGNGGDGSGD